ncbi:MAG: hypothetical protein ABSG84_19100 [Acidobacteriaceae bacterium]|jgi:hypothetical protein
MVSENGFYTIVPAALTYLYKEGRTGHWVDARTTAYVLDSLIVTGESLQSKNVEFATAFLLSSFRPEQIGGSWGSEIWDTALVLRTLSQVPVPQEDFHRKALDWIASKQLDDGSFDGEPWDSLYVALALLKHPNLAGSNRILNWLLTVQSDDGSFISNHYTGLFCQVMAGYLDSELLDTETQYRVRDAATLALGHLWNSFDKKSLWGGSAWTNAFVVKGIAELRNSRLVLESDHVFDWYRRHQSGTGAWDDPVRTAISVEALWKLQLFRELDRCRNESLQTLTAEFFSKSTESELTRQVSIRTIKAPVITTKKLLDRDENGNRVITLTPDREKLFGIIFAAVSAASSAIYGLVTKWPQIKAFLTK